VEHLASLRAIPNLNVLRPADATETAECWQIAIESKSTPSALALTRQNLAPLRKQYEKVNLCSYGAYELAAAEDEPVVSIFASGSEVAIALEAKAQLDAAGHPARVVSVPSFELFEQQDGNYRKAMIGDSTVRIAIEAGVKQGWQRFIGEDGIFIGMSGFGASAPATELYQHFGITAKAAVEAALEKLNSNTPQDA
jgi:transketolase